MTLTQKELMNIKEVGKTVSESIVFGMMYRNSLNILHDFDRLSSMEKDRVRDQCRTTGTSLKESMNSLPS